MKAVILAGGFGKRLRPLTDDRPKPMIEVAGVPIIERQIRWLMDQSIKDIVICVGYKKEVLQNYLQECVDFEVNISYSTEATSLGTGGALRNASSLITGDKFVFLYGDIMTDLSIGRLVQTLEKKESESNYQQKCLAAMAVIPLRSTFGIVEMEGDLASSFREKPILQNYWMNAGVFCFSSKIIQLLPERGSLEADTLAKLAKERKIAVVRYENTRWRSIDSHKDVEEAEREFDVLTPSRMESFLEVQSQSDNTDGLRHSK